MPRTGLISYHEFVQRVRRHRPSELLPAIARTSVEFGEQESWTKDRVRLPWALAAAAKASIISGNEYRATGVGARDVYEICFDYTRLDSPLADGSGDVEESVGAFLLRTGFEQFLAQLSPFEEIARVGALFEDTLTAVPTEILTPGLIEGLLGCTLNQFVAAGFVIAVGAMNNGGFFDPAWEALWEGPRAVDAFFPMAIVARVFRDHFCIDIDTFRQIAEYWTQDDERLHAHEYNPLVGRPFIQLPDGRFVAPQPKFAMQRLCPSALYYTAVESLGRREAETFTTDVGSVFQEYVGRQLHLIPGGLVVPEVLYDSGQKRSVDWFVVFDDAVLLVEAKSTRLSHLARMGGKTLVGDIDRSVGKAIEQINRTDELITQRHGDFAQIPSDRPRLGIVATMEPHYFSNIPFLRKFMPEPSLPVSIASIREVEQMVDVMRAAGGPAPLGEVIRDPERRLWNLANALPQIEVTPNPILEAAWERYPIPESGEED